MNFGTTTWRTRVELAGRIRRFELQPGENLIGSSPSCDITLDHPSISRTHAILVVADGKLQLADAGSTNGTFLGDQPLRGIATLDPADPTRGFRCGDATLHLEAIDARDARPSPAVAAPAVGDGDPDSAPRGAPPPTSGRTTAAAHPLSLFAHRVFPEIVNCLAASPTQTTLAQTCGQSLFELLPLRSLEIRGAGGQLLFRAERPHQATTVLDGNAAVDAGHPSTFGRGATLKVSGAQRRFLELSAPLLDAVARLIDHVEQGPTRSSESPSSGVAPSSEPPLGSTSLDPVMRGLERDGARIARSDVPILITGESGTGKEFFARRLHAASRRADGPFKAVNCAALPRDLLEAELFGIESGVATGVNARAGCFEQAHGGTLFLDEIGDMAPEVQSKLLRVLETGAVRRVGGQDPRPADVRLISATNRDIRNLTERGEFRLDLYYRLADWEATLPPLRDRPDDLANLVSLFLERAAREHGIEPRGISQRAMSILLRHHWPGNVRELEREVRRALLLAGDGELLDARCLSERVRGATAGAGEPRSLEDRLLEAEALEIRRSLVEHGGQAAAAAAALDVPLSTFYRKLKAHGLRTGDG